MSDIPADSAPIGPIPAPAIPSPNPTAQPQPLTASDERTWAMLAHLSILLNLITGLAGPIVALAIYFVFHNRSRYIAYQSLQSFVFQLLWWVGAGAIVGTVWAITGITSIFLIGLCLIPIACFVSLMPLLAPLMGIYAAIETSQGADFKYPGIGDWLRGTLVG